MKLIENIQKDWRAAKDAAAKQSAASGNRQLADALNVCAMFTGTETVEEMAELIYSPRAIEFMTRFNFPDVSTFRKFKKFGTEQYNVFIDAGKITLTDTKRCFLIGNTTAVLNYAQAQGNRVYLMCGAKARINAGGYSVVKIEKDASSTVEINVTDKARILQ